jgi:lysophospholipase L1-like esterase
MNMKIIKTTTFLLLLIGPLFAGAQDWPNLNHYRAGNEKLKKDSIGHIKVVYMGDSITDFWIGASPDFFAQNGYVDRGISGQTSPQMLLRFRTDVIELKPKAMVLLCGTNDIAGNTGLSTLEMTEGNIMSMAELAKANKIKVILCSVLPANKFGWKPAMQPADSIINLNNWISNYAQKNHFAYVDYYPAMVDEEKGLKKEFSKDGVHPNKAGYTVMEQIVETVIRKIL